MPILTATILLLWQSGLLSYSRLRPAWRIGMAAVAIPLVLPVFQDARGLGFAVEERLALRPGTFLPFDSPRLSTVSSLERGYVEFINDGIGLVRAFRRPGDTIMSLDFSNPFSFALAMPPATGGTTCLHYNDTFSAESHPSAEALFGNASLLAVPTYFSSPGLSEGIPLVYGAAIRQHFRPVAASRAWVLFRRGAEPW